MRINPPILFWILIGAVLAGDRFLPLYRFAAPRPPSRTRYWTMNERRAEGLIRTPKPVSSSSQTT